MDHQHGLTESREESQSHSSPSVALFGPVQFGGKRTLARHMVALKEMRERYGISWIEREMCNHSMAFDVHVSRSNCWYQVYGKVSHVH